jgi:carboxyl-terminal processing protease
MKKSLLFIFIFTFSLTSVAFSINKNQYSSLLLINKSYQMILSNYYKPLSGTDLLNSGLNILRNEGLTDKVSLSENLNNEQAFKEFNRIFLEGTEHYKDDLNLLSVKIIRAMLLSIGDKYSSILTSDEYNQLQNLVSLDSYSGIGISLAGKDDYIYITSVFPESPAFKAGLKSGDIIMEINGKDIQNYSSDMVYNLLSGDIGKEISLNIIRNREKKFFSLKIQTFKLEEVKVNYLSEDILYIKIYFFSSHTTNSIMSILRNNKNYKGLIIDLRDNPGGDFQEAVNFSGLFSGPGPVILEATCKENKMLKTEQTQECSSPLILLINENTMSSAEIVASALKTNHRATLVGKKTFGKGLVQGIFSLDEIIAMKLTIAEVFTVNKEQINIYGVKPDIEISCEEKQLLKGIEILSPE